MECRNIQEKLSAYMEGVLSDTEERLVRGHLSSCPDCRTALEDLQKTSELLGRLDRVEAPPWLSLRIMGRIRDESEGRHGIISWLFRPFRVKVPLQAFAFVLIVGLVVLIYKENVSDYESVRVASPSKETAVTDQAPPAKAEKPAGSELRRESPPATLVPKNREMKQTGRVAIQGIPDQAMSEAELPPAAEKKNVDTQSPQAEMTKEAALPAPPAKMKEQARAGAVSRDEETSRADAFRTAPSAMAQKSERQRLFDVTVRTHDAEGTSGQIEDFLKTIEARNITTETRPGAVTISAEVRNDRVPEFMEMLKRHTTARLPSAQTETLSSHFPIRIRVVAP